MVFLPSIPPKPPWYSTPTAILSLPTAVPISCNSLIESPTDANKNCNSESYDNIENWGFTMSKYIVYLKSSFENFFYHKVSYRIDLLSWLLVLPLDFRIEIPLQYGLGSCIFKYKGTKSRCVSLLFKKKCRRIIP